MWKIDKLIDSSNLERIRSSPFNIFASIFTNSRFYNNWYPLIIGIVVDKNGFK